MSIEKNVVNELLEHWMQGQTPDWSRLYPGAPPSLSRAPTYPFAKSTFWVHPDPSSEGNAPRTARPAPATREQQEAVDGSTASHPAALEVRTQVATATASSSTHSTQERVMQISLSSPLDHEGRRYVAQSSGARIDLASLTSLPPRMSASSESGQVQAAGPRACLEFLTKSLAQLLMVGPDRIGASDSFEALGVDSLVGNEWLRVIKGAYPGVAIGIGDLVRVGSVGALAASIAGHDTGSSVIAEQARSEPAQPPAAPIAPGAASTSASASAVASAPSGPQAQRQDRKRLVSELALSLAKALYMEPEQIDTELPVVDMGLDSIIGVEWIHQINRSYGVSIQAIQVYDYPSVERLAELLGSLLDAAKPTAHEPAPVAPPVSLPPAPVASPPPAQRSLASTSNLGTATASATQSRLRQDLQKELVESLASALYMDASEIDPQQSLMEMGLDSIIGVEWIHGLNRKFGVSIQAIQIYDHPNIDALTTLLTRMLSPASLANAPVSAEPEPPTRVDGSITAEPRATSIGSDAVYVPPAPASGTLLEVLLGGLAAALFKQPQDIDAEKGLEAAGMDTVVAEEWLGQLNRRHGTALRVDQAFALPSISELARLLGESPGQPCASLEASAQPQAGGSLSESVTGSQPQAGVAARQDGSASSVMEPIAIIGMSGRYPAARDLDAYWSNLAAGRSAITEMPLERWDARRYYDAQPGRPGKVYSHWIGLLDDVDHFDPAFFKISPAEAQEMDPQHRIFLQEGYRAFEHAGYPMQALDGTNCGVYLGIMNQEYRQLSANGAVTALERHNSFAIGAARLAYHLNLKGPAIPVDTACSSALVAIHLACQALRSREIDMALAGGVTLYLTPQGYVEMCSAGMLSPDGRCKTFDDKADGFVPGEGVGAVVLKRLSDAERDGDPILATIIGSGINQDGKTNGITAPNRESQFELVSGIHRKYGIDATTISYMEAHGTGTKLGDPIELAALRDAFRLQTQAQGFCAIGSVKSNIGHTSAAAGIASLHKVLLCLRHRELVPTLHYDTPNQHFSFEDSPFYVGTTRKPWAPGAAACRRAAVSSFGFSGTNAHLVIQEYDSGHRTEHNDPGPVLLPLSARDPERLAAYAAELLEWLRLQDRSGIRVSLADLAYTFQVGRKAMAARAGLLAHSTSELERQLTAFIQADHAIEGLMRTSGSPSASPLASMEDEDLAMLVQTLLQRGKPAKVLELWVQGADIDWRWLYQGTEAVNWPRRIGAPAYPFAPQRHWVSEPVPHALPPSLPRGGLPLQADASAAPGCRFQGMLTGDEPFLRDHRIAGVPMMPGSAYIEYVHEAVQAATTPQATLRLEDVTWLQVLSLAGGPQRLQVDCRRNDDQDIVHVEVSAAPHGEPEAAFIPYCRCTVRRRPDADAAVHDLPALQRHFGCEDVLRGTQACKALYERFDRLGMAYGPSHRAVQAIHLGAKEALVRLSQPSPGEGAPTGQRLDPGLLDSALHAMLCLIGDQVADNVPVVPHRIGRVDVHGKTSNRMWAWLRMQAGDTDWTFDIDLMDERGAVQVALRDVVVKAMAAAAEEVVLLQPKWTSHPAAPPELEEAAGIHFAARHVWMLSRDAEPVDIGDPKGMRAEALIQDLIGASSRSHTTDLKALAERFGAQAQALSQKLRELLLSGITQPTLVQLLVPGDGAGSVAQAFGALLKTVQLEHPLLQGQLILVQGEVPDDLSKLMEADARRSHESCVRYADMKRQVLTWEACASRPEATSTGRLPWRQQGVYLMTGAGGGLGRIVAEAMASEVGASRVAPGMTLVLTGRSPANRETLALIDRLRGQGVQAQYHVMDVSDAQAVKHRVERIVAEHGSLHGVIHCAGLVRDRYLLRKSAAEFNEVLRPKVSGTVNLDLATRHLDSLDFFLLFSSGAGAVGNAGQSDYAVANAFMDAYAAYRSSLGGQRSGSSLSIAWPLWLEGGMTVDTQVASELRSRLAMTPMPAKAGIEALHRALAGDAPAVFVNHGQRRDILALARRSFLPKGAATAAQVEAPLRPAAEVGDCLPIAVDLVKDALVSVLKLPASQVGDTEHFENYGIDSINAVQLIHELERVFGPLPKTLFFEHRNLRELAQYLVRSHASTLQGRLPSRVSPDAKASTATAAVPECPPDPEEGRPGRTDHELARTSTAQHDPTEAGGTDIAVVGMSGQYAQASDLQQFWERLRKGHDCIEEVPAQRWDWRDYFDADGHRAGKHRSKWGGFVEGVDEFDPQFFNISPREAGSMDPKERLFLQQVWTALEDAGLRPEDLQGLDEQGQASPAGVYVGLMYENYQWLAAEMGEQAPTGLTGGSYASIANRISFFLDLHGPSVAVDTMCSSSLVAVHLACRDLLAGDVGLAIAGGVNLSIHPNKYRMLSSAGFMSPRGRCESFGRDAEGYVPGEGVGVLLLKRRADAERDGDRIYGLIKASAVNHGGRTNGYTVPNAASQAAVIAKTLKAARVDPRSVGYIEAHGTGTRLGDPIELAGLSRAFADAGPASPCWIGSVKSNIGHCEGAAGVAALTKVLLQLKHRQIVPSLHSSELNPHLQLSATPWVINQSLRDWERPTVGGRALPRAAGVSSFGAGGTNAHLLLTEYESPADAQAEAEPVPLPSAVVVPLSAKSPERLNAYARRLQDFLQRHLRGLEKDPLRLVDLARTLQRGRVAMQDRLAMVVDSLAQLTEVLAAYVDGQADHPAIHAGRVQAGRDAQQGALPPDIAPDSPAGLATRWVRGELVEWPIQCAALKPRRIGLPTYPFLRDRYWLKAVPAGTPPALADAPAARTDSQTRSLPTEAAGMASKQEKGCTAVKPRPQIELAPLRSVPVSAPVKAGVPAAGEVAQLEEALRSSLASALFLPPHAIDVDRPFHELGLDSIVGVEWIRDINQRYQASIRATDVYDYPSVRALAGLLRGSKGQATAPEGPPPDEAPALAPAVAVAARSQGGEQRLQLQDVLRALQQSLAESLRLSPDAIDATEPFARLGLDSIVGVEWIKGLNARYGTSLKGMDIYDHPTLAAMAALVHDRLLDDQQAGAGGATATSEVPAPAPVAAMVTLASPQTWVSPHHAVAGKGAGTTLTTAAPSPDRVSTSEEARQAQGFARTGELATMADRERIAIVGMSGRYPGAPSLQEFWDNLATGRSSIVEVPPSRWSVPQYYDPTPGVPGKTYCKWIGLLEDVDCFDPTFFRISPAEAEEMDPQHRLFLQEGYQAIERMGVAPSSLSQHKCGVYLGLMNHEYGAMAMKSRGAAAGIGSSFAIGAARLPYYLNLKGPAIPVDTACSSSLVATHLACQALQRGEIDLALAGGATLYLTPESYVGMCAAGMLSAEGKCKTFDDGADGFVPGEGVGALVLKRLSDAERDGDPILGVIIASGINQDGRTNGITAPSGASQAELIRDVYQGHGIDPRTISYVEAHGTGTKLGDPIELRALETTFRAGTDDAGFCALGSVKSNVGHTSAAAGMASVHKVLLCMAHQELVPTLHFSEPNRHFDFQQSPFYVNTERQPWPAAVGRPRRAAVSSFGFSGTNAHLVIEEYAQPDHRRGGPAQQTSARVLLPISARDGDRLRAYVQQVLRHLQRHADDAVSPQWLADFAFTMQVGRDAMEERLALVAGSAQELLEQLQRYLERGELAAGVSSGRLQADSAMGATLFNDEDFALTLQGWIRKGKHERIAELWVQGMPVEWAQLYEHLPAEERPVRRSAPTYPFAKLRCWVETLAAAPAEASLCTSSAGQAADVGVAESLIYVPVWNEVPQVGQDLATPRHRLPAGMTLVVHRGPSWGLVEALARRSERLTDAFVAWNLDAPEEALATAGSAEHRDVGQLVDRLRAQGIPTEVFFLAGCSEHPATGLDEADRPGSDELALLRLVQALARTVGSTDTVDFHVLTLDHHSLGDGAANPWGAGVAGLAYAIAQGDHRFQVRNVDLTLSDLGEGGACAGTLALLSQVLALESADRGALTKLRSGRAYQQGFLRLPSSNARRKQGLRQKGVYLILGGSGHVGQALTRQLMLRYQAQVVWMGRSAPDASHVKAAIADCTIEGAAPAYVQADVLDATATRQAVQALRQRFGKVDGAIFSGMVFDADHTVAEVPEDRFMEILRTKAEGSRHFFEALRDEALDFLCYFSSAQSYAFSGATRLGAYASATTAGDAWVRALTPGAPFPMGTIHWGFWKTSLQDAAPLDARHVGVLTDEEGFECFEQFVGLCVRGQALREMVCMRASRDVEMLMGVARDEVLSLGDGNLDTLPACQPDISAPAVAAMAAEARVLEDWLLRLVYATVAPMLKTFSTPAKSHARWWKETFQRLETNRLIRLENGVPRCLATPEPIGALWQAWKAYQDQVLREGDDGRSAQFTLVDACLQALPDVLGGALLAADVLFPQGSMARVEGLYRNNRKSDLFNAVQALALRHYVQVQVEQGRTAPIRILEIGAGTGGTTVPMLKALEPVASHVGEYHFTDVSKAFLMRAEELWGRHCPFLRTGLFDVEQALAPQGIAESHYDVVIATNVLHATRNVRLALRNAKACLRAGGLLLLSEISEKSLFTHLTFGLLEGWWLYEDASLRLPGSPVLSPRTWREVLEVEGFSDIRYLAEAGHAAGQQVIQASSNGLIRQLEVPRARHAQDRLRDVASLPAQALAAAVTSDAALRDHVSAEIRRAMQTSLKLPAEQIRDDIPFINYGIDSILGVRFIDTLNGALKIPLKTATIFEYATVRDLACFIASRHAEAIRLLLGDDAAALGPDAGGRSTPPKAEVPDTVRPEPATPLLESVSSISESDIAVIGMAGQFPGAASVEEFWQLLQQPADTGSPPPNQGRLQGGKVFDHDFFQLTPEEAAAMHPYQRLVLQECWKALENATTPAQFLAGARMGVFVGAEPTGYRSSSFAGASDALIASRVSYHLNLRGPAYVINTGCSSGGVAIHLACESLRRGEADGALACGVFAAMGPDMTGTLQQAGMLSAGGRCRSFDASADGTAFAEGLGVVVLKRLSDALACGDPIHGVIRASGVNQDGTSNGILAPNGVAQEELIVDVYRRFSIAPERIDYVEAHGTGTLLGDAVEVNALARAFSRFTDRTDFCALDSVKATIGHTAAASGVVGLIKVLLALRHRTMPGLRGLAQPNPMMDIEGSAFHFATGRQPWPAGTPKAPRLAALNVFGHSGTNVHLVVQEHLPARPGPAGCGDRVAGARRLAVPLSATNRQALRQYAGTLKEFLLAETAAPRENCQRLRIQDVAFTMQAGRSELAHRLVLLASDIPSLLDRLDDVLLQRRSPDLIDGNAALAAPVPTVMDATEHALRQAAQQWVSGGPVAWPTADATEAPVRVHLPVLSLDGERPAEQGARRLQPRADTASAGSNPSLPAEPSAAIAPLQDPTGWLRRQVGILQGVPAERVDSRRSLVDQGCSSLDLVALAQAIQREVDSHLMPSALLDHPTIEQLAAHLLERAARQRPPGAASGPARTSAQAVQVSPSAPAHEPGPAVVPTPEVLALLASLEGGRLSLDEAIFCIESTQ